MQTNTCALCLKHSNLQRSHAIPDSIFRKITKSNNGQAIIIKDDEDTPLHLSSDSWWSYQLCIACEQHINASYEQYSISVLRAHKGVFKKCSAGVTFTEIDTKKLQLFFLSILWRAASSDSYAYSKVHLPEAYIEMLRTHIINKKPVPLNKISAKISRLIDKTTTGGFDQNILKSIITAPFPRISQDKHVSFLFIFEGFLIEFQIPGVRFKNRTTRALINPFKNMIFAPYVNIFDIPELIQIFATGLEKYREGKSRINNKA